MDRCQLKQAVSRGGPHEPNAKKPKPVWITLTMEVPPSLHRRLIEAAASYGIPLEQFIAGTLVNAMSSEAGIEDADE
jgi:predicted HicB family RNase H-like nuclease